MTRTLCAMRLFIDHCSLFIVKRHALLALTIFYAIGCGDRAADNVYTGIAEGVSFQVPALTGGKINQILVEAGQEVEQGDLIAVIDTVELAHQKEQLFALIAELEIQKAIAVTSLKRTASDLEYITQKHERIKRLVENNSMPEQNLDDLENQLEKAGTAHTTAQQSRQSIEARQKQIEAQLKTINKKISDAIIFSPATGIVADKYFEMGEAIRPLTPIVEVIRLENMDVKIYVSETRLSQLKYEQAAIVRVDGLNENLSGRISWISPKAEFTPKTILTPDTRTSLVYAINVRIPNPDDILKHGMPVTVELQ